jgi:methionine-S-sulfoxide reductase
VKKILLAISFFCLPLSAQAAEKTAIFAGGCFWCMESDFEGVPGVKEVISGYTGGEMANPTYRDHGQHLEAVRVIYDDTKVDYAQLLHTYWRSVDPTDDGGQFCDRGHSYTTAVFVGNEEERKLAEASKAEAQADLGDEKIVTPIRDAGPFTDAEDYHQDYYKKNPARYAYYRHGCGRDAVVEQLWGKDAHAGIVMTH